jgi:hypothetical protein
MQGEITWTPYSSKLLVLWWRALENPPCSSYIWHGRVTWHHSYYMYYFLIYSQLRDVQPQVHLSLYTQLTRPIIYSTQRNIGRRLSHIVPIWWPGQRLIAWPLTYVQPVGRMMDVCVTRASQPVELLWNMLTHMANMAILHLMELHIVCRCTCTLYATGEHIQAVLLIHQSRIDTNNK